MGFPFDLAWLDLSARCLHLLAALRTFLRTPPADAQVIKALETLERMLRPLEKDQPPFLLRLERASRSKRKRGWSFSSGRSMRSRVSSALRTWASAGGVLRKVRRAAKRCRQRAERSSQARSKGKPRPRPSA